ncbi:MAG: polyprenyl synthetase family protein [Candidatus Aenigmarchaeota archaeon]|nr:polyprenyl synthetase family protein [Candidatus Aenigmarchaeota archaeon]
MIDFMEILKKKKPIIWEEIQKYLPTEGPEDFIEIVSEYPRRQGKYGRGALILLSCEGFGEDPSKAVKTAAAMQMSEDWLLVHDDIQDYSEERRGKPALHKIHGIGLAMNAGDYMHLLMWKILMDNREVLDEETTWKIMKEFYRFLEITARGQHLEHVMMKKDLEKLEYDDYYGIVYGKAAEYTINGPLRLGAIIAGKGDDILEKISEVGIPLGIAFQIRDDILNIVGKQNVYGKEIGGDILEGKRTLMIIHLIKNAEENDRKKIIEIMKKQRKEKTNEDVRYIIDMMKKYGSIEFAENKAKEFADKALSKFKEYFSDMKNKEEIEAAINFFALKRTV